MEFVTLNNGVEMPVLGTGTNTFGKVNGDYFGDINDDTTELLAAIKAGYRSIDTAIAYRNESVVGKAIKESGIPREAFFITSKIPGDLAHAGTAEKVEASLNASLEALDTDYIDLYLIHHPWDDENEMLQTWYALENAYNDGKIKAIGVSNFDPDQLDIIIDNARIQPMVNQVESHVGKWNDEIIAYSLENDVIPTAWGPMKGTDDASRAVLTEIGDQYGKTWGQVVLRYQIERGVIVIPKSHNAGRQADNFNVFDFALSEADKEKIAAL
ncbi:MAG: aldo/keto reductase [Aerococcus viridans]|nr:MAG: aldo/keto reductase [Aerococcus viridans]